MKVVGRLGLDTDMREIFRVFSMEDIFRDYLKFHLMISIESHALPLQSFMRQGSIRIGQDWDG